MSVGMDVDSDTPVGISFGSSESAVAVYKEGRCDVVANAAGHRTTPSMVSLHEGEFAVGFPAKQRLVGNVTNTVVGVRQLMGLSLCDAISAGYKNMVSAGTNDEPHFQFTTTCTEETNGEDTILLKTPIEVAGLIVSELKTTAESFASLSVTRAVVAVPSDGNDAHRAAMRAAIECGGMSVSRFILQPIAACLAYGIGQGNDRPKRTVLVFHMGGKTCNASVVDVRDGIFRLVHNDKESDVNGSSFDDKLVNHFVKEFKTKNKVDLTNNHRAMAKMRLACEEVKRSLSTSTSTTGHVESISDGMDFHSTINRSRFELLCGSLFRTIARPIDRALEASSLTRGDVTDIVLSGGATAIPKLQKTITNLFTSEGEEGVLTATLHSSISPDEVLAVGAAAQAALIIDELDTDISVSTNATAIRKTIGVRGADADAFIPVAFRGTAIPFKCQLAMATVAGQTSASIDVFEGEATTCAANTPLAKAVISDLTGGKTINVSFSMAEDSPLRMSAIEEETGKHVTIVWE